jgi:oxygen-independent coproporphyrinogen-3 oxidase
MFDVRYKSHHNSLGLLSKYYPPVKVTEEEFLKKLEEEPADVPRVVYVHTPYCDKICSFCNMNREQLKDDLDSYANYVASEFDKYGQYRYFQARPVDVIYFGGGTPTIYKPHQLEIILSAIGRNITFGEGYEFTFETTLHNLSDEKLEIMQKYGVNRLSVGIQSFNDRGREFYNRTYDRNEVIRRIKDLKSKFNGEVCVDIIYNYPNQTIEEVVSDARTVKELDLGSSSFYSLMVHEGSNLSHDIRDNKVQMNDNLVKERELHDAFVNELTSDSDYYTLELTKIAKKGRDNYRYIKARNNGGDTFPIGNGAGGNVGNIGIYRMRPGMTMMSKQTPYHQKIDRVIGALQFPEFSKEFFQNLLSDKEMEVLKGKIEEFKQKGLIEETEDKYILTESGFFWGNNVSREIVTELVEKGRE